MKNIIYGTVFLIDKDFSKQHIEENLKKMCKLRMNTVVFWPPVFYDHGKMNFDLHLYAFAMAAKYNLNVIVELTGQVTHLELFPENVFDENFLVSDKNRNKVNRNKVVGQNGLGELNYNNPAVMMIATNAIQEIVGKYKDCAALYAWDVWNETHFKSYDNFTLKKFQLWLKDKYNSIRNLNSAWNKTYSDFSQIRFDNVLWSSIMPDIDLENFRRDNMAHIISELTNVIKNTDKQHPVIADNVMSNVVWNEFDRGTDDWKIAKQTDLYGISFYPKTGGRLLSINTPWIRSLTFAGAASAGAGKFILSEIQSHYYSDIYTPSRVSHKDIVTWCMEAISHNAKGLVFWKWAPFRWGFQIGGRGLLLADGSYSKRAHAVESIGNFLNKNQDLIEIKHDTYKTGILFDRNNWFTIKSANSRISHIIGNDQLHQSIFGLYTACFEKNIQPCIISIDDLSEALRDLKILFLTYQVSMDEHSANILRTFIKNGGIIIANYPFLDIDEKAKLHRDIPGGYINDIIKIKHIDNLLFKESNFSFNYNDFEDIKLKQDLEIQELEMFENNNREVIATINDYPFLISTKYGNGIIYYITSSIWNYNNPILSGELLEFFIAKHLTQDIEVHSKSKFVKCETKKREETILFLFNYYNENKIKIKFRQEPKVANLTFGNGTIEREKTYININGNSPVYVLRIKY